MTFVRRKPLNMMVVCTLLASTLSSNLPAQSFALQDGTPVRLRLNRNLSSAEARLGETVDFEVLEEVSVGGTVVVKRGATALATVTEAKERGRMGKAGKLNVNIDHVRLVNGDKVALRAIKETTGSGKTGTMTGAMVATSIVFFPAAPLFLFMRGKDVTIPKGTEITAYVNGEVNLDARMFGSPQQFGSSQQASAQPAVARLAYTSAPADTVFTPAPVAASETVAVTITSDLPGAEVEIDNAFVGSTPSSTKLAPGVHKITVKHGVSTWSRNLNVQPGSPVNVNAILKR